MSRGWYDEYQKHSRDTPELDSDSRYRLIELTSMGCERRLTGVLRADPLYSGEGQPRSTDTPLNKDRTVVTQVGPFEMDETWVRYHLSQT